MSKSCPNHAQITPNSCPQNHPKIIPKSFQNHSQKCILPAWFLENLNPNDFSCPDSKSLWKISMKVDDFWTSNLKVVVTKTWNFQAFLAFLLSHFELWPCTCVYIYVHISTYLRPARGRRHQCNNNVNFAHYFEPWKLECFNVIFQVTKLL